MAKDTTIMLEFLITRPDEDKVRELAKKVDEWAKEFNIQIRSNDLQLWEKEDVYGIDEGRKKIYPMITFVLKDLVYTWELEVLRERYLRPIHPNIEVSVVPKDLDTIQSWTDYYPITYNLHRR